MIKLKAIDDQTKHMIERMELGLFVDAGLRLIRELNKQCTLTEDGLRALLDFKLAIAKYIKYQTEEKEDAS